MQEAISACLEEDLLSRVQASELPYSLLIDESTDLSTQKHLIMYIMFWDGTVNTHFLANLPIEDCSATGILSTVEEFLKVKRLPLSNCFGFGAKTEKSIYSFTTLHCTQISFGCFTSC